MSLKKLWIVLLITVVAPFALFAAGGQEAAEEGGDVVISYHCWYPPEEILAPMIAEFEKLNPGIKVEVTKTEPDTHQQKVPVVLASKQKLDTMAVMNTDFVMQVEPYMADLEPLYSNAYGSDWEGKFQPSILTYSRGRTSGDLKMLPEGMNGSPVIYFNVEIFNELGLSIPETETDLMKTIATIKSKRPDLVPLAFRGKLPWLHTISAFGLYAQEEELWSFVRDDGKPYNSPEIVKMAQWWQSLYEKDIFAMDTLDIDNNSIGELFYGGNAAMMVHGAWMAGLLSEPYREKKNIGFEIGAFPYPAIKAGNTPTTAATPDMFFSVVNYSDHQEEAFKLMDFFIQGEGINLLAENFLIVPGKTDFVPNPELLTTDLARNSYKSIIDVLSNPQSALRQQDFLTTPFGKVLQNIALGGDVKESLDDFQKEIESGKFE
ncbi:MULTISPECIES: ABC transporter substrate-binding protein [unclassified Oceanispirochaeta]|uniref:ABC transporter substrate-binding protein n=1 Tax=unclassified Oceanispirochaeta TaxID=2635722 RepID=UPI000E099718|nr:MULTISPECIES: ABC transporter substrate-binding protein [unclassified Oceanispirochaeta]MBF9018179.1 carbohydrate ABC transporter substrate-binding protein [Oceanispirochaeta sp. M2]NPD74638.1 carbohydrate ABC transporter substrate-binding protein [Oceanispirochaeta sp. M1]RDG29508.1 carbohydrate ABC transporter substrate-binding protein [Oceanispirochaeta sp. M1]